VFALLLSIIVFAVDGRARALLAGGRPTPDPRWRAIATEQALSWDAPTPIATRTPRAASNVGTPPNKSSGTVEATRAIPTRTPSAAPTATTSDLLARIARAENALRSGNFTSGIEYDNKQRVSSTVRFILGPTPGESRLHLISLYRGTTGERRLERVIIGEQVWERAGDGAWESVRMGESIQDQIVTLLPASGAASAVTGTVGSTGEAALRWQDRESDAAVEIHADPRTGIPQRLVRTYGASGAVQTVDYQQWNVPIEILQPVNP
jgi:hypothetical protein